MGTCIYGYPIRAISKGIIQGRTRMIHLPISTPISNEDSMSQKPRLLTRFWAPDSQSNLPRATSYEQVMFNNFLVGVSWHSRSYEHLVNTYAENTVVYYCTWSVKRVAGCKLNFKIVINTKRFYCSKHS